MNTINVSPEGNIIISQETVAERIEMARYYESIDPQRQAQAVINNYNTGGTEDFAPVENQDDLNAKWFQDGWDAAISESLLYFVQGKAMDFYSSVGVKNQDIEIALAKAHGATNEDGTPEGWSDPHAGEPEGTGEVDWSDYEQDHGREDLGGEMSDQELDEAWGNHLPDQPEVKPDEQIGWVSLPNGEPDLTRPVFRSPDGRVYSTSERLDDMPVHADDDPELSEFAEEIALLRRHPEVFEQIAEDIVSAEPDAWKKVQEAFGKFAEARDLGLEDAHADVPAPEVGVKQAEDSGEPVKEREEGFRDHAGRWIISDEELQDRLDDTYNRGLADGHAQGVSDASIAGRRERGVEITRRTLLAKAQDVVAADTQRTFASGEATPTPFHKSFGDSVENFVVPLAQSLGFKVVD